MTCPNPIRQRRQTMYRAKVPLILDFRPNGQLAFNYG